MAGAIEDTALLVRDAVGGDQRSFAVLVDRHAVRLLVLIRRRGRNALGPDCGAEDLFQTVVMRAWQLLPAFEYRGPASFQGWLTVLVEHAIGDRLRYLGAKGRGDARRVESVVDTSHANRGPLDPATSVASLAARREETESLDRALESLPPADRRVLELHLLEAKSLSQLATELAVSKSTAWSRLDAALDRLRQCLPAAGGPAGAVP